MKSSEKESDIVVCICYIHAMHVPIHMISNKYNSIFLLSKEINNIIITIILTLIYIRFFLIIYIKETEINNN